jgi:integrase
MSGFAMTLAARTEGYIALRRSLGYSFKKQAAVLGALLRYVECEALDGPLTRAMAVDFVLSWNGTPNGRAIRYGVVRRFADYLAIYDPRTEALDPKMLPRSRAIPPPRILSDEDLGSLMSACRRVSPDYPGRALVLAPVVGLLASSGLRSGEALRLDRADVDLVNGVLHVRQTKFRKDRLVPVHATTRQALRDYAQQRDVAYPTSKDAAFFLSSRGNRLSRQVSRPHSPLPACWPGSITANACDRMICGTALPSRASPFGIRRRQMCKRFCLCSPPILATPATPTLLITSPARQSCSAWLPSGHSLRETSHERALLPSVAAGILLPPSHDEAAQRERGDHRQLP